MGPVIKSFKTMGDFDRALAVARQRVRAGCRAWDFFVGGEACAVIAVFAVALENLADAHSREAIHHFVDAVLDSLVDAETGGPAADQNARE